MPFKISENISKSLNFSLLSVDQSGDQCLPKEFQEGGGLKKIASENIGFRGKIKVGYQSSPEEYKGRLLKTNTLLRREGS